MAGLAEEEEEVEVGKDTFMIEQVFYLDFFCLFLNVKDSTKGSNLRVVYILQ